MALLRERNQPIGEYLPARAAMALWAVVHLRVFPAIQADRSLDSWLINLIFEMVMEYPIESVRQNYYEEKKKSLIGDFEDSDLIDAGYSPEALKGNK